MKAAILLFTPSGQAEGLHTELIPLGELGLLRIQRWTMIEFNNASQEWEVKRPTDDPDPVLLFSHVSRQACLDWEHRMFTTGDPDEGEPYNPPTQPLNRNSSIHS